MSQAEEHDVELAMINLFIANDEECERDEQSTSPIDNEIPRLLRETVRACRDKGRTDFALFLISIFPFWSKASVAEKEAVIDQVASNEHVNIFMSALYRESAPPCLPQPSNN